MGTISSEPVQSSVLACPGCSGRSQHRTFHSPVASACRSLLPILLLPLLQGTPGEDADCPEDECPGLRDGILLVLTWFAWGEEKSFLRGRPQSVTPLCLPECLQG